MSRQSSPVRASEMRPGPTSNPASRRMRPNVTTWRTNPPSERAGCGDTACLLDECDESFVADRGEVLVVLQDGAERLFDDTGVELLAPKCCKRLRPVDRLGHARRLREVQPSQTLHECCGLPCEPVGNTGHAQDNDFDFTLERRMIDPVEEATSLERVMELTRAIGGQDHRRTTARTDCSDLRNGDLEVRQHLEHDRLRALDRFEERPSDQELRAEELLLGHSPFLRRANVEELP